MYPLSGPLYGLPDQGVKYEILMDDGKRSWLHHNHLKQYHGIKFPPGYFKALQAAKAEEQARTASSS